MEEEMDLESMKRRDLQRLCKKHGISSNSTNSAMVVSLRSIFQKQKNSKPKGCLKGSGGSSGEGLKKVTFVLDEEEDGVEILGFGGDHGGRSSRRTSRVPDAPVRSMRSRGLAESVLWSPVIEKKRARVGKQAVCGNSEEEVPPLLKSLRNRVVEVGGNEQVVLGKRPRDAGEAVGQKKKLKEQAKDGEAVAQAARRTRHSSSGLSDEEASWDGETTLEKPSKGVKVNKLATEPVRRSTCSTSSSQEEPFDCKAAVKDKHLKQVKTRDTEVVTEPVRRMTRNSMNLGRDEVGKLGGEAVRKGKSKRQAKAHVSRGGEAAVPVSDSDVVIPSTRRSTRSSSKLLDDDIPSLGVGKPRKQGKKHVSRGGDSEVSVSASEAVILPAKRTTRSSSTLLEDDISLPAVGKPPQQAKNHVSRRGDLEVTVPDTDSVISPMRRTTRSSSLLLENEKSLPECGKVQQQAKKHVLSREQSNVSVSNSEAVISPTKRSTRSSSKMLADESSLLVVGKLGTEAVRNKSGKQAKKEGVSKASLSESEAVNEPTRRMTRSSSLEDEASLPVSGKSSVDTEAVKKYKSDKQAKNHASNLGVSSALVLDSKFVAQSRRSAHNSSMLGKPEDNKAVMGDKPSKQSKKRASKLGTLTASLVDTNSVAQPARRSSRSSPMHDSLGGGTYLPLRRKLDDDGEAVYTNKSEKQVRSLRSRKGDEQEQEISLSVGGDSVNKAENGTRKKIQKQHGDQDLKEEASKASVSDFKRGAELEGSEVHKNIDEPPRRTTRSASKHGESNIMPVGVTASDRIVETSSRKKRTRAGYLENVSVVMRETVQLGSLGIHNAGSRKSSRKSLRNFPTESETVRRESSPETAMRLLEETVKASSVKSRTPGKQISSYKQSCSIFETEDDQTLTSSENHEKNDHNIVGGDKAKALELHEVMHTTENVPLPFSGPTPSIDLYVAGETDAGNEAYDFNKKNVSEPSFPAPIKLLEAEKGTTLEGSSNIIQSSCVQEWHDERTSSVNNETEDHNIVSGDVVEGSVSHEVVNCSENVSLPESSSGALSVDLSIAVETDGVEIGVNDVIGGNCSQLQQSPVTEQSQEVEKGIFLDGPSNSEQQNLKQELKVDGKVASSGNQDLEDHSIVGKDQAGVAEAHKAIPIVEIETTKVVTEKNMTGVDRSPVSIQLQEVKNILSFEGARNASASACHSYDPSIFSSGNHYKTVDGTSLVVDSDTGGISNLWRVSHIEMESSGADLDGEPEKVAKETPVVGSSSHLSDGDVEEVKETCQSPTLFLAKHDGEKAEAEAPPLSLSDSTTFGLRLGDQVTDHGTQQAGLDCGSYKVSEETACNRDSPLSGAVTAEAKGVCLMPILSLLESDGAGTVGNQVNGEIGESSFHSEDVKSTEYSVISKGMGALTDATLCGDSEKVVEAKNTLAVALHNSGEGVAAEFSSSIAMAGEVFSDQSRAVNVAHFVNYNSSGDVKDTIETEDVSLVGTTEASLPYSETYDAPSRTNDVEKVVHDYPSSARGPGGLDRQAILHSDQQRNPGDSSPDLASADYEVVPQVTVGPTHELLDAKFKRNLGLTDVVVEEIEIRESLKGEGSDDCEDLSVKELDTTVVNKFDETILEQGDAYEEEIECRGSLKGETTEDCKYLSLKELDTAVVDKFGETILEQGDAYVEGIGSRESLKGEANDDCEDLSVKEHDTTVVDKFGETILEQRDASELQVPLETSQEPKTSEFSSHGTFETPECQDSSPSERVLPVGDFSLSENVENEHVDKENAQGTSAEEKMVKEENNIEDDTIMVKKDNIAVNEFDEVREQCSAFFLAPLNRVVLQTTEDVSSAHIETPASQVPSLHKVEVFLSDGHVGQENVENASSEEVAFSEGHLSSPRPSANLGEGQDSVTLRKENFFLESPGSVEEPAGEMVVLSSKPVSKLDNEKAVQEKSETGILCNAHAVEPQEDRLGVTRDADEDVSQPKAESLLEASVNIEEPIFCSTSGSKYSKSVDTFQCGGAGVYEKSTYLCLNSIEKAQHCTGQSLVVGQQEQITAGIEADSSIKNESYTNQKVDIPMPGMNQYDTEIGIHEVEKLPPKSGESLVGNQDLTSIKTEEVSAIEVGKASPQYISAGIKEISANEDEKSSPTSVPSLVGLQVQTSMDIQGFSATGTDDRVDKAPVVKDNMALLFAPFHYNPREDASCVYTERSEDKLDSWVFGDMTGDMDLTEMSDELNYRAARQGEVGVSNKRQGEFNRFEQSPVSRSVQPRAEDAGPSPMYLDLFCMDDEGTNILNDSGHVDQWEKRLDEEKSHFNEGENYLEVNSMKEAGERKETKSMCFSRNFDAESKDALFFASEAFAEAENISASHQVQEGKSSGQGTNAVMKDEG